MSLLKTKRDKDLFAKWNKKLEKYKDCNAEDMSLDEPLLKVWHNFKFKKVSADEYTSRIQYFDNARHVLNTFKFERALDCKIWTLHVEGFSLREIGREVDYSKDKVRSIINRISEKAMPK